MNWLNLETAVLHSPEFIGCKPAARATWLCVSLWCATQENGGRIAGARAWGSRQWQQMCGVTLREIESAQPLLTIDGEDLVVWNYPTNREAEVKAKRDAGRSGGVKSGEARAKQSRSSASSSASTEVERKGKEGEVEAPAPLAASQSKAWKGVDLPTEDEWRAEFHRHDMPPEYADHQYSKQQSRLWKDVLDWRGKAKEIKTWWLRGDMEQWRTNPPMKPRPANFKKLTQEQEALKAAGQPYEDIYDLPK